MAEFSRNSADGSLTQLASPDNCIQDTEDEGSECGNENGLGLGGRRARDLARRDERLRHRLDDIAEFSRTPVCTR